MAKVAPVKRKDHGQPMQLQAPARDLRRRWSVRKLWPLLPLAAVLILFFALDLQRFANLDGIREHQAAWRAFVDAHELLAIAIYAGICTATVLCGIPIGFWLTLIGGFLFGAAIAFPVF